MVVKKGINKAIGAGTKTLLNFFESIEAKLSSQKEIERIRKDLIIFAIKHVEKYNLEPELCPEEFKKEFDTLNKKIKKID